MRPLLLPFPSVSSGEDSSHPWVAPWLFLPCSPCRALSYGVFSWDRQDPGQIGSQFRFMCDCRWWGSGLA